MNKYDIIVVGGGPAGLTAALYTRRANKSVLVIEKNNFGGQITFSPKVENIPGFNSVTGNEFAEKLVEQVINQGAEFENLEVTEIKDDGEFKIVKTDGGDFSCRAVIIATGAKHRTLGLSKEEDFIGNGISFCAVCDGAFFMGKHVGVVGGGNSALQEALLLSDTASKVTVIQNLDFLTGEKKLCDQLYQKKNVEVLLSKTVAEYLGDSEFKGVVIKDEKSGELQKIELDGLFLAVGLVPQNEFVKDLVNLDQRGYITSGEDAKTNANGIFVAGDCRTKRIRQVATAISDGAISALSACDYIDGKN